jgi:hypothetical protein
MNKEFEKLCWEYTCHPEEELLKIMLYLQGSMMSLDKSSWNCGKALSMLGDSSKAQYCQALNGWIWWCCQF